MTTAREVVSPGADCVRTDQSAAGAARIMTRTGVGALPVCGPDSKIKGVVTDRDVADVARSMPHPGTGDLVEALSSD
ncbi:CBS domain-containing protein [Streptomyces sp. HNM0575]|uniref:CBS domain-containing protein n=1 Tax=Streptomyces sp. HNM0575 TaxID=2716338 RepID=UPI00145D2E5C|nr:CBS domain-containing protein [Streptomyces sp. HNM0575]NLU74294.1 CBS domain-containing protein [Streptomyces sp. HNM0575]